MTLTQPLIGQDSEHGARGHLGRTLLPAQGDHQPVTSYTHQYSAYLSLLIHYFYDLLVILISHLLLTVD